MPKTNLCRPEEDERIGRMKTITKEIFEIMLDDWRADHPEMDDLEISEVYQNDLGNWVADAEDATTRYQLCDDRFGNVSLEYIGTK